MATTGPTDWTFCRASVCPSWALTRWCAARCSRRGCGGDPRRARATPRARCHLDQLGPVLVLVRAQLQPQCGRLSRRRGRSAARGRTRHPRTREEQGPARHLLRRDDHRAEGAGPRLRGTGATAPTSTRTHRSATSSRTVRLNANVNEHPRGSLLAFADGGLINVMPGQMHSHLLADHPELVAVATPRRAAQAVPAVLLRGAVPPRRGSDRDRVPCPPLRPRRRRPGGAGQPTDAPSPATASIDPRPGAAQPGRTAEVVALDGTPRPGAVAAATPTPSSRTGSASSSSPAPGD